MLFRSGLVVTAGVSTFTDDLTVNTDALFVDASTKAVGIGTGSSVIGAFEVKSTQATKAFFRDATSNQTVLSILTDDTSARIQSTYQSGGSGSYKPMAFYTSNSQRMQIDTSGSLLIGGTLPSSPATTITSAGAITAAGKIISDGSYFESRRTTGTSYNSEKIGWWRSSW